MIQLENPYQIYAGIELSVDNFITITNQFSEYFINYCEILILKNSRIKLCVPSHQETLFNLSGLSWDDIPVQADVITYLVKETESIAVWYNYQRAYRIRKIQKRTLKLLATKGLIQYNVEECYNQY